MSYCECDIKEQSVLKKSRLCDRLSLIAKILAVGKEKERSVCFLTTVLNAPEGFNFNLIKSCEINTYLTFLSLSSCNYRGVTAHKVRPGFEFCIL